MVRVRVRVRVRVMVRARIRVKSTLFSLRKTKVVGRIGRPFNRINFNTGINFKFPERRACHVIPTWRIRHEGRTNRSEAALSCQDLGSEPDNQSTRCRCLV